MSPLASAVLAGLFFGIWPLVMNRSGLSPMASSAIFYAAGLLVVLPFAVRGAISSLATGGGMIAAAAGLIGVLGLLAFNSMLSKSAPQQAAALFMALVMVQITVPALYSVILTHSLPASKAIGLAAAFAAAFFLSR